jgi:WD40 repeat protein
MTRPVRALAFSPDERQLAVLDDQGIVTFLSVDGGAVSPGGRHVDAHRIDWSGDRLMTASKKDVRFWPLSPLPRSQWVFRSTPERRFNTCQAADGGRRWLAAGFRGRAGRGVLIRAPEGGGETELSAPGSICHGLAFSEDGSWLLYLDSRAARIWRTGSWQSFDLPLEAGDGQFLNVVPSRSGFEVGIIGKRYMNDTDDEYIYSISGSPSGPPNLVRHKGKLESPKCLVTDDGSEGWTDAFDIAKYQAAGRLRCSGAAWEAHVWCRDNPLGADDCDIEFVPADMAWAMRLYEPRIWRPEAPMATPAGAGRPHRNPSPGRGLPRPTASLPN